MDLEKISLADGAFLLGLLETSLVSFAAGAHAGLEAGARISRCNAEASGEKTIGGPSSPYRDVWTSRGLSIAKSGLGDSNMGQSEGLCVIRWVPNTDSGFCFRLMIKMIAKYRECDNEF